LIAEVGAHRRRVPPLGRAGGAIGRSFEPKILGGLDTFDPLDAALPPGGNRKRMNCIGHPDLPAL